MNLSDISWPAVWFSVAQLALVWTAYTFGYRAGYTTMADKVNQMAVKWAVDRLNKTPEFKPGPN